MCDSSSRPSGACSATTPWVAPPGRWPRPWAWVAPPSCCPWPRARGGSLGSLPLASGARWLLPPAPDLGRGVSPPSRHWPRMLGSSSRPPALASGLGGSSRPFLHRRSLALWAAVPDFGRGVALSHAYCAGPPPPPALGEPARRHRLCLVRRPTAATCTYLSEKCKSKPQ